MAVLIVSNKNSLFPLIARPFMDNSLKITYTYLFPGGDEQSFELLLNARTLSLITQPRDSPPPWTLLTHNQCINCPLDSNHHRFCPVALNFAEVAEQFAHRVSYEEVRVIVTTAERTYLKDTALQQGLSSLLGVVMTTSGCPVMEPLKPMVQMHLPFATLAETVFRAVSMFLLAQYLRFGEAKPLKFGLKGLASIYAEVAIVNRDFVQRLREAATEDADINALMSLDCFATMVPLIAEHMLKEIRPYFSAYFDEP
jgi:hypothetical protein